MIFESQAVYQVGYIVTHPGDDLASAVGLLPAGAFSIPSALPNARGLPVIA